MSSSLMQPSTSSHSKEHSELSATPPTDTPSSLFRTNSARSATSAQSSSSRSPRRLLTDPTGMHSSPDLRVRAFKRIVVFCDGTWQDGVAERQRSRYTNVLRLARSVNCEDELYAPPVMQVMFYQSGIGSDKNFYSTYIQGTTGDTLGDKVEEAYAFIAHNFNPGDEIFLFGFSRGAYTARMVAQFIAEIGVLDRKDMDNFASIFVDYQKLGMCRDQDSSEKKKMEESLAPWRSHDSKGHKRASFGKDKFTVKCVGVWDTVGNFGLPEEISIGRKKTNFFGFNDRQLGDHIEQAYQALAINEMRVDFDCNKWIQTDSGREKSQILKQCWFTGCHSDIGGGYRNHDLSDLTLIWMAAQVGSSLSLDIEYLRSHLSPVAPWGTQQPHDSVTGVFLLAQIVQRTLPTSDASTRTCESVHSSVLEQTKINAQLAATLSKYPDLIAPLADLERQIKENWPYDPVSSHARHYQKKLAAQKSGVTGFLTVTKTTSWIRTLVRSVSSKGSLKSTDGTTEPASAVQTWISTTTRAQSMEVDAAAMNARVAVSNGSILRATSA